MNKKYILIALLFWVYNIGRSQIYQHFIFVNNIPLNYDMPCQQLAQKAIIYYYNGNNDSSIFYYRKLLHLKPDYYQGYFNIAKAYAQKQDYRNVMDCLKKYVRLSKEKCICSYLTETEEFKTIIDSLPFLPVKDSCCYYQNKYAIDNKLRHPEVLSKLQYLDGREQEILGNTNYWQKDGSAGEALLKNNFTEFAALIDTTNLPGHEDIGKGTGLVQLIVLHCDYYPSIQYNLGKKILISKEKGYDPKMGAYIIDRSLQNMGKPQLYGTVLLKNNTGEEILYQYDDLEEVKKRREKLHMQTIEEYLKNKSITK